MGNLHGGFPSGNHSISWSTPFDKMNLITARGCTRCPAPRTVEKYLQTLNRDLGLVGPPISGAEAPGEEQPELTVS